MREKQGRFQLAGGLAGAYLCDCLKGASPTGSTGQILRETATGQPGRVVRGNSDHSQTLMRMAPVSRRSPAFDRPPEIHCKVVIQPDGASAPKGPWFAASAEDGGFGHCSEASAEAQGLDTG